MTTVNKSFITVLMTSVMKLFLLLQLLITSFVKKVRTSRISLYFTVPMLSLVLLTEALLKSNIPYTMVGGTKFYSRKEIRDVISYLNLIANPADNISFERVVNEPNVELGLVRLKRFVPLPMSKT